MIINNAFEKLQEHLQKDMAVGISIGTLLESDGLSFYVTDIPSGKKITPHYHNNGEEIYIILKGSGVMHTWSYPDNLSKSQPVKNGDVFKISPKTTHQLENNSNTNLTLLFVCQPSHLSEDRIAVDTHSIKQ